MSTQKSLGSAWWALRIGLGLGPFLAGLKFDKAGNEKTVAALKATKKTNKLRAVVEGDREGETINVKSITID